MESQGDLNESTGKTDSIIKGSANFTITKEFYVALLNREKDDLTEGLLDAMYDELKKTVKGPVDSVGLWVDYDNKLIENSIKMDTLSDMKKFGQKGITPIYEFFKMTIGE